MLLVFLLIILIITSQFEWKQPLVSDVESNSSLTQKQHHISNAEETVKEKVFLSFSYPLFMFSLCIYNKPLYL
jgi:hypothetical protein